MLVKMEQLQEKFFFKKLNKEFILKEWNDYY